MVLAFFQLVPLKVKMSPLRSAAEQLVGEVHSASSTIRPCCSSTRRYLPARPVVTYELPSVIPQNDTAGHEIDVGAPQGAVAAVVEIAYAHWLTVTVALWTQVPLLHARTKLLYGSFRAVVFGGTKILKLTFTPFLHATGGGTVAPVGDTTTEH